MFCAGAFGPGDDVHLGLETHTRHADRLADAFLMIDDEFLREDVQDLLVRGNRHGPRGIDHAVDVAGRYLLVADRHDAVRVEAPHMTACDPGEHRVDLAARHQLGFLDRALDRLHGRIDVDDHALLETARRMRPDAHDLDRPLWGELAHDGNNFRRSDVESDNQVPLGTSSHRSLQPR